jgi:hypothetical protein
MVYQFLKAESNLDGKGNWAMACTVLGLVHFLQARQI